MSGLQSGETYANCVLLEQVGVGAAGKVWRARQKPPLDRDVAIKFLVSRLDRDEEFLTRFQREATVLARLNHPNIVTIHAFEQERERSFLVMEYVAGKTLEQVIPENGMNLGVFMELALQMAEALAAAHGEGIVHRDLKPQNIMVLKGNRTKILDFGLAKVEDAAILATDSTVPVRESRSEDSSDLTADGRVMGTWKYMSPEQCMGWAVDARSDVFSLGVIFHLMLSGKRPFKEGTQIEIARSICEDEPLPLEREDLPPRLIALVRRCLEKKPNKRFSSATELARELRAIHHLRREYHGSRKARDAYEKALFHWDRRYGPHLMKALHWCDVALVEDPKYAEAHALKANAYNILVLYGLCHPGLVKPAADLHSAEAVRLNGQVPETWTCRGMYLLLFEWGFEQGESYLRQACTLGRFALARWWLALLLAWNGRLEDSLEEAHGAVQWEASSPIMQSNCAFMHYYNGDLEKADELITRVEEREPNFPLIAVFRCWQHLAMADVERERRAWHYESAIQAIRRGLKIWEADGPVPSFQLQEAYAMALAGREEEAIAKYEEIEAARPSEPALAGHGYASAVQQVKVRVGRARAADERGDCRQVRRQLSKGLELIEQRALPDRDPWLLTLGVDPAFVELMRPENSTIEMQCGGEWAHYRELLQSVLRAHGLRA